MKTTELRQLIREEVKAIVKEQHLHEEAEYFPARMIKHLQRAILAALKDGTVRIAAADTLPRALRAKDFLAYAEDIAVELVRGKSLKDILNNIQ